LKQKGCHQELSPRDCRTVGELDVFSHQFGAAAYAQSDLGTAMVMGFRAGKWLKERSDPGSHQALFSKINDCDYVIEGLREYVFSLCCAVFERIQHTANVRKNDFFDTLGSIWESREAERRSVLARAERLAGIAVEAADRAAAVSRARERPVDLTDDIVRGGSDTE